MRLLTPCLLLIVACAENPADSTPSAATAAPAKPAEKEVVTITEPPEGDAPAEVAVKPAGADTSAAVKDKATLGGHIHFTGSKVTGSHTCRFDNWTGHLTPGPDGVITSATLSFTVEMASLFCDWNDRSKWTEKFEKHLKNEDFFEVEKYPQATFTSHKIETTSKGSTVTGALSMRGIVNVITFPAMIKDSKDGFSAQARFDIDRKKWGIVYKGKSDNLIRDEVVLDIALKTK